ncbi:hypothetical protein ACHRV1_00125 [Flavobacterium aquidurense]|jgi:hypothetical protein|uniref:hypothetical protein n=1 Tax=Flavobacterium aquidurense TaxID=362413 RepID=UPI000913CBD2|nr:hypothetical protein [Flavobacterium aquidurense]OXA70149.1 hypothetical protein B0A67_17740 [Flavobacterium aquidurense]SHG15305.1 hypothetical protein SAMN05444481_102334 [Flavobacterium frigidimaris]
MNPKILITSIFVTSLVFTSCKKELEPQENTPTSELVKLGLAKDTTNTQQAVVQNPATNPNTVMGENNGINPAHGQPGHRCDIAVGAPLNSAPTQGQTTQTAQPVQVNAGQQNVVTTTTVAPAKVAKGMNPAHGQPGHRCDIAVGAPLNSAPAKQPATTTAQSGTTSQNFTVTPPPANNAVPALLSTEETAVADGMNPAHGKPGHRCDIAVGAPLPKS